MKRFLLLITTVLAFAGWASAGEVTIDFNTDNGPTSTSKETKTINGVELTYSNCKAYSNYLMINKSSGYLEFKLTEDVTGFKFKTGSGASTAVTVTITAGSTEIAKSVTLNQQSTYFAYTVPADAQAAGTVYKIAVTNNKNAQLQDLIITTAESTPTPVNLAFA